jgi:hypothetical protein
MASDRDRMLVGEPYLADDPQLIADRRRCRLLTEQLNSTSVAVLATGVIVGPGVTIGEDSVVGAGSVVTKDLPAGHLCFGNPCRVVREL